MNIWAFVRKICEIRVFTFSYFVSVYDQLWVIVWLNIGPTQSDIRIFVWNVLWACLGVPGTGLKYMKRKWFLPTERPEHYWPFWRAAVGRGTFSPLAPVLLIALQQKKWLCHPLPLLFMAVGINPNAWRSSSYCMRYSWLTQFGAFSLNQAVDVPNVGVCDVDVPDMP